MGMLSSYHYSSTHFYRSRYEYTHQEDRMWRKNRAKTPSSLLNILGSCKGVDLNRFTSFPLVFLNFGSSPHQEFWIQVGRRLWPTWPCRCHAKNHIHLEQKWIWFHYSIKKGIKWILQEKKKLLYNCFIGLHLKLPCLPLLQTRSSEHLLHLI